jgi:hypothetical protein
MFDYGPGSFPTAIAAALDALDAAVDAVNGLAFDALGCGELLAVLSRLERAARRAPIAGQVITVRLGREATPLGGRLLAQLNPDGDFDDKDRARHRGFRKQADGMSQLNGWITPELRATLEPGLHKLGAPAMANPDDDQPRISGTPTEAQIQADGRSGAQRNHDALLAICRSVLSSGELGRHLRLPVTVIVSTTLQDLHAAAGHGVTSGGTLLPMRDLICLASNVHHYLCIFDKATEKPLNLFRTKRCASDSQRVALQAIHRGCTFTRRGPGGRAEWIPPAELDVGQARSNDFHHRERLLGKAD